MKQRLTATAALFVLLMAGPSCRTSYQGQSLQYKDYRISQTMPRDTAVLQFLQPFSDSVNNSMNKVLGVVPVSLEKSQPESTLGNFMADAFLTMAREKYQARVDLAFVNFGGIRLTQLPAGNVTRGKVFELMPFDNLLILQKLKGSVLQQLLDLTAARGGWPMAGLTMQIKNNKAVNVQIGGQPLDPEKIYTIANSDFIANGGDNADMLRSIPQIRNGYLMRDAIIDYIGGLVRQGKGIGATIENRVSYAQ
ncbi:MAG: 5'-nucleotidase C-terminal domain-containing protein [Sphingobacteriales bacterium]|nr:5'-nucleotidase C-terminal domain-containing protein [Sphingobacteriales bacterium]